MKSEMYSIEWKLFPKFIATLLGNYDSTVK